MLVFKKFRCFSAFTCVWLYFLFHVATKYNIFSGRTMFAYSLILRMQKYIFINQGQSQFFKYGVLEKSFILHTAFSSAIFSSL